jgi:hypothetical protein
VISTVKPSAVDVVAEKIGSRPVFSAALPVTVELAPAYPVLEVAAVIVALCPAVRAVMVIEPLVREMVPALVVTFQVYAESKLVIVTVKPVAVETGVEKVGVSAALRAEPLMVALPPAYPVLEVVTVTVTFAPAARPVTVSSPVVLFIEAVAPVTDVFQVYEAL